MTRRTALAVCCAGFLVAPAFAGDEPRTPPCCAKKTSKETAEKTGRLRCSLTGKDVEKCCCIEREGGKLHCALAKKDVEKCCCTELETDSKKAK